MHYAELDADIRSLGLPEEQNPLSIEEAGFFFAAMRKIAQAPEGTLPMEAAPPPEAMPPEAAAEAAINPVEQVAMTLAQLASQKFKTQLACVYYTEMLRDIDRGSMATFLNEKAWRELDDAKYFLRRLGAVVPGGIPIPVPPSPAPLSDPSQIISQLVAGEQQTSVLLQTLHGQLGADPSAFTIAEMLSKSQNDTDRMQQFMPAKAPKSGGEKVAAAIRLVKHAQGAAPGAVPVLTPEQVALHESQAQLQQVAAENQDLALRLQQTQEMAVMHQNAAEQATATAQQSAAQAEEAGMQAASATQQAQGAMEQATASEANAASQADAKMRLSMRIQQLRQHLADIVSSDPVAEEDLGGGSPAGPGSPQTAMQQQQAQNEQAALEQEAAMAQASPKAAKEVEQARKAETNAAVQGQQAQEAATGKTAGLVEGVKARVRDVADAVKGKAKAVASDVVEAAARPVAEASGRVSGEAAERAARDAVRGGVEEAKTQLKALNLKSPKVLVPLGAAAALYGAGKGYGAIKQHKRDARQERLTKAVEALASRK